MADSNLTAAYLKESSDNKHPFILDRLAHLREQNRYRFLRTIQSAQRARIVMDGRQVLLFCSNNYLGLADHPALKEAAKAATEQYGCGSGASRLISGNMDLHEKLERRLASFKQYPSCLLFNNGYTANIGIISSLMEKGDVIFSDALNHASIIDGCRLSRADAQIYRHRDVEHLESLLRKAGAYRKRLIVTDALFSMDGDLAPLPELAELARRYDCLLMTDEAHAIGVMGPNGRGVAEHYNVEGSVDISMGTLGKALGGFGAFVVCHPMIREYLINYARSLIFSTSLPPSSLAAAIKSLEILQAEPERRSNLHQNAVRFAQGLSKLGLATPEPATPIQSVLTGEEKTTMSLSEKLLHKGIFAQGIRPPTVPAHTSRIRFALMATHRKEDIQKALNALSAVLKPAMETSPRPAKTS